MTTSPQSHLRPPTRLLRVITIAAASCGLAFVAACGSSSSGGTADGISLVSAGQLTVCTHLPYKPFEYNDNGNVVGFDVSMVDLLAKELNVKTNVISIGWDQITGGGAFAANKCDVGMGAATITPARQKAVAFSDPYFNATQALLVKKGSGINSLADLKGKKLAVQTSTTGQIYAEKYQQQYGYTPVIFDDSLSEFNALLAGSVDAAINDNGPELYFAEQNPTTEVTKEFDTGEHYGFMAKKDDPNATKLLDKLNQVIAKSQQDGTYNEIFKQWFGKLPAKINEK